MKFAIAGIFLSQSRPTSSAELPTRDDLLKAGKHPPTLAGADIFRTAQQKDRIDAVKRSLALHLKDERNGPQNIYCDPTSTDPDTGILSCGKNRMCQVNLASQFGGTCVPKTNTRKKQSYAKPSMKPSAMLPIHGRLVNNDMAANQVPCDPTSADIGILACGQDKVCRVDDTSELGGFCAHALVVSRRLDTVYNEYCGEGSRWFCDCSDFNNSTGTGVVHCFLGDYPIFEISPACKGVTLEASVERIFESEYRTSLTKCYTNNAPFNQTWCFTYLGGYECSSLTLNGQLCRNCSFNPSYYYDCSNVEGGRASNYLHAVTSALKPCFYPFPGNGSYTYGYCKLCNPGYFMDPSNFGINLTIPGVGETTCGYLARAQYFGRMQFVSELTVIPDDLCSLLGAAAQSSCCGKTCKLCGPSANISYENYLNPVNLADRVELEGRIVTCGDVADAAYSDFDIPVADGTCDALSGLIQQSCCKELPNKCSLCDGPLRNPFANVTIGTYNVQCFVLQSLLSVQQCDTVSKLASSVCCSLLQSTTPAGTRATAPLEESGVDSPHGSEGQDSSDTPRSILTRGCWMSCVASVMMATVILIASC